MLESELQFITFNLDKEFFAIDIMSIQEIIRLQEIVKIPQSPDFVEGIIDLRGVVIPIISLRKKFQMSEQEFGLQNKIIICNFDEIVFGLIVDEVGKVMRVLETQLEEVSAIVTSTIGENFIRGIVNVEEGLLVLLKLEELLSSDERELVRQKVK